MSSKYRLIKILIIFLTSISTQAAPIQFGDNKHWYEFIQTPMYVTDARNDALSRTFNGESGYLATITSQAEQDFIKLLAGNARAWFGLSDSLVEGEWRWMDGPEAGDLLSYSFWAPGEPNDYSSGEDFASINWLSNGQWNDWGGPAFTNVNIGYIVEYNNAPDAKIPTPSVIVLLAIGLISLTLNYSRKTNAFKLPA